LLVKFGKIRK